jgi:hypothetical protein
MMMFGGIRVEIVPADDADADPRIPKDVLEALGPDTVLMGLNMMYIRAPNWERIKHRFPQQHC